MSTRTLQSPVLVGRDDVLYELDRHVEEAAAGRGTTVLIAGEAGIGKSRIVASAVRQAQKSAFRIGNARIAPQDQLVSLASVLDLARGLAPEQFGSLGHDLLSVERTSGRGDSLAARRILVHDIVDRVRQAVDKPVLFVFEDLHWADELSLEVVGELARHAANLPLLIIATYRPEEPPVGSIHREWRSRLLTQRVGREITLGRLDAVATAQMATLILATGLPAPRDVADAVFERTNGIPLHVEELLAALGEAAHDGRAIRLASVPSTIEDAVLARLARLTPAAQATARAGAVMGRSFLPDTLAGILGRAPAALDDPLDELVAAGVLAPFQATSHGYFDFRHQLLRDAIYASVPTAELRRYHARAAEFGAGLVGASEVHKSVHYERAGLHAEAFRAAKAGAEAAAAVTSRFESFELYRRAVANIPVDLPADEAADVWAAYAVAGFAVDDVPAAEQATHEARQRYLEARRPLEAALMLVDLSSLSRRDVRPRTERKRLLDAAEAEMAFVPDSAERNEVYAYLRSMQAVLDLDVANLSEARRRIADIQAVAPSPDVDPRSAAMWRLDIEHMAAWADVLAGDVDALDRMLALSREARDADFEGTGVTNYRMTADVAARIMEYPTSAAGVTEGIRYADAVEQSYCRHVMSATTAIVAW
ncbi:MAG TPA: AAA family ATPase, partial [Candidatus Limnocylindrales bacterium]|nr:AAA family ATPase [Candidatus Limnocylindrales bacterium]